VALLDHTQVLGNCGTCHDGVIATGKHPTHISSGDTCDDCHTSAAWLPATFDHTGITGNCQNCHDGTQATGKHLTHINTTNLCEDCHSTLVWAPVTMVDHTQILGSCSSCHDGVTATGKSPIHFGTSRECDDCHDTFAWAPHIFTHMALPYEPLDHASNPPCSSCHQANAEAVFWSFPAYQPNCAGCHASDFKPDPHKKHENPDVRYSVGELSDCSGSCHVYMDSTMNTIKDNRPGPQHRISDGSF
jgi:predicted CXXCH cytochrome family protein